MRATIDEYRAVEEAALKRLRSVAEGNSRYAKEIFTSDAMVFGRAGDQFDHAPIQAFFNNIDNVGSHPSFTARIDVIALEERVAVVRVLEENWGGNADFTDILFMLKIDGDWKCVTQAYNQSSATVR